MNERMRNARRMAVLAVAVVALMGPARIAAAYVVDQPPQVEATKSAQPNMAALTAGGGEVADPVNIAALTGGNGAAQPESQALTASATGGGSLTSPVKPLSTEPAGVTQTGSESSKTWINFTILVGLLALAVAIGVARLSRSFRTPAV